MSTATVALRPTPLGGWIARRFQVSGQKLTREAIEQNQLQAIRRTVEWARQRSSFYANRLSAFPIETPRSLDEMARLPFTFPDGLVHYAPELLCVSQDEISRIVTLHSSGTSGAPKRIFFTAADQELALDFFAQGVAAMAAPGDRMLIALPGEREGSVGFQLAKGIARAGIIPISHGLVVDPVLTLDRMEQEKATSIIGLPVQMLALAMKDRDGDAFRRLRSIVLCSDHVPDALIRTLQQKSGANIFEHYGMTEMGLGGGVDCEAHAGYHLREADLYFEIVDPETGAPLPDGETGEIVFTTMNRTGMPLIRYRTGDLSRFLPGLCPCGTILKRLDRVRNRIDGPIPLGSSGVFNIAMLDEALFSIPGLLDFTATITVVPRRRLQLRVYAPSVADSPLRALVRNALNTVPSLRMACAAGELDLDILRTDEPFPATGAKRRIEVVRSNE